MSKALLHCSVGQVRLRTVPQRLPVPTSRHVWPKTSILLASASTPSRQVSHKEMLIQSKAEANLQGNTYTAMTKEFFGHMSKEETEQQLQKLGVNTKMLEPEDVARVIVWLLSEASMDVNGVNLPVGEGAP